MKSLLIWFISFVVTLFSVCAELPGNSPLILGYKDVASVNYAYPPGMTDFTKTTKGSTLCLLGELIGYDPKLHIARVTPEAAQRIANACHDGLVGVFFADGIPCYTFECFETIRSFGGLDVKILHFDASVGNEANIALQLGSHYPKELKLADDPRNNQHLMEWLAKHKKLTAPAPPH